MAGTNYFVTQGTQLYVMNTTVTVAVAVVVAALQGFQGLGGQKASIKLSNFDSPGFDEYAGGLIDPGKPNGNVILDFNSTAHQLLNKLLKLGQNATTQFFYGAADGTGGPPTVVGGNLQPPVSGVSPNQKWARSGFLWTGFVNEFSFSAAVSNVIMAKFSAQASGAIQMCVYNQNKGVYF